MKVIYDVPTAKAPWDTQKITVDVPMLPPRIGEYVEFGLYTYKVKRVVYDDLDMSSASVVLVAER